jgi:hypothetical protein
METQILADEPQRAFSTALRACATTPGGVRPPGN